MTCKKLLGRYYMLVNNGIPVAPDNYIRDVINSHEVWDMLNRDELLKDYFLQDLIKKLLNRTVMEKFIIPEIQEIAAAVKRSVAGKRSSLSRGEVEHSASYSDRIITSRKSTFPEWFGLYFPGATKETFLKAVANGKSKHFKNIVVLAIESLLHGRIDYDQKNDENLDFMDAIGVVPF